MNNKPLVSIITVSYNSEKFIEDTINSVRKQTYNSIEHIIIDGNSIDNTVDIINKYDHIQNYKLKWISEKDNGMYEAINKGIKMSNGDYLAFLNSDDIYFSEFIIERVVNFFSKNKNVDWIFSDFYNINENNEIIFKYKIPKYNWKHLACSSWSYITHPTTFFKKNIFDKYLFNENYKMAADYEFFLKIGNEFECKKTDFVISKFRIHSNALTSKNEELNKVEMGEIKKENNLYKIKFYSIIKLYFWIKYKIYNYPVYFKKILGFLK
jgi:glycosyltransferase involved in cell wall biosynthesis